MSHILPSRKPLTAIPSQSDMPRSHKESQVYLLKQPKPKIVKHVLPNLVERNALLSRSFLHQTQVPN